MLTFSVFRVVYLLVFILGSLSLYLSLSILTFSVFRVVYLLVFILGSFSLAGTSYHRGARPSHSSMQTNLAEQ